MIFAVRDPARRKTRCALFPSCPAVSETGVVFDVVEVRIAIAELLADALDEGSYVGTIALRAVPGDEVLAVDEIIDFPVTDVLLGPLGEKRNNLEFGQREVDRLAGPQSPVNVEA